MTLDTQVLIAFLLYLFFWGWVGYRRGAFREIWLLFITVITWVVLQERGTFLVRLANFGGKFVTLVSAGGLTGEAEDALQALADAPNVVTEENQAGFLFLAWAFIVVLSYVALTDKRLDKRSKPSSVGFLFGAINGLVFAALLLPILSNLVKLSDGKLAEAPLQSLFELTAEFFTRLVNFLRGFWQIITPVSGPFWFMLITLILIFAGFTLRSKGKSGEKAKS